MDDMTFADYDAQSRFQENYPTEGIDVRYLSLALAGEAGELANVVKKAWRAQGNTTSEEMHRAALALDSETAHRIADEAGDVLWYLAAICDALGLTLADIARTNVLKVRSRYQPDGA